MYVFEVVFVHVFLQTLLRFLNWIPLGYIFETKVISTLVYKVCWWGSQMCLLNVHAYVSLCVRTPVCWGAMIALLVPSLQFLHVAAFRNVTMKCLTEIGEYRTADVSSALYGHASVGCVSDARSACLCGLPGGAFLCSYALSLSTLTHPSSNT